MKTVYFILALFFTVNNYAQSDAILAKSYFLKAQQAYSEGNNNSALEQLEETLEYLGTTNAKIEALYVKIAMNKKDYLTAEKHLNTYFKKANESRSDYMEMLGYVAEVKEKKEIQLKKIAAEEKAALGKKGFRGETINGKKEGKWTFYWKDGSIRQEVFYKNDRPIDTVTIFYDDNWKITREKSEVEYFRTLVYDKSGGWSKEVADHYKNGDIQMTAKYISEEEAKSENSSKYEDDTPVKWYYKNGQLKEIAHYNNFKLHGENITYYENGVIKSGAIYKNGMPYTVLESFNPDGETRNNGSLKEGNGTIYNYSDDGKKYIIDEFKDGNFFSETGHNNELGHYIAVYGNKGTDKYNKSPSIIAQYYDANYSKIKLYSVLAQTNKGTILKQTVQYNEGELITNFYVLDADQNPTVNLELGDIWFDGNARKWSNIKYANIQITEFYNNGVAKKVKAYTSNPDKVAYSYNFIKNGQVKKKYVRNKNLWEVLSFDINGDVKTKSVYKKNGNFIGKEVYR
jgi:antitoxin component YwqK of YwqJK toxin-antitoxin module|tara:strand:+ start:7714 stop:9255 length:1542 start_codon:yes stop_codon:yes gene_type:complete